MTVTDLSKKKILRRSIKKKKNSKTLPIKKILES